MSENTTVIVSGARTPMGRLSGSLKGFSGSDLGGFAIKGALEKAGLGTLVVSGTGTYAGAPVAGFVTALHMERLRPFFPKSHGKPRVDDRRVLSGIIFVNRNGLRWSCPTGWCRKVSLIGWAPLIFW